MDEALSAKMRALERVIGGRVLGECRQDAFESLFAHFSDPRETHRVLAFCRAEVEEMLLRSSDRQASEPAVLAEQIEAITQALLAVPNAMGAALHWLQRSKIPLETLFASEAQAPKIVRLLYVICTTPGGGVASLDTLSSFGALYTLLAEPLAAPADLAAPSVGMLVQGFTVVALRAGLAPSRAAAFVEASVASKLGGAPISRAAAERFFLPALRQRTLQLIFDASAASDERGDTGDAGDTGGSGETGETGDNGAQASARWDADSDGDGSERHVTVCGVLLGRGRRHGPLGAVEPLVPLESTMIALRALAAAARAGRPAVVCGPAGCGKTSLVKELARRCGQLDLLEMHLDDQMDAKSLLGGYVCTEVPGEFRWAPGALASAVASGQWVLIEDIDRAPFEVLAALLPLLDHRRLPLPHREEPLVAHSDFRIFATRTVPAHPEGSAAVAAALSGDDGALGAGFPAVSRRWTAVRMRSPSAEELRRLAMLAGAGDGASPPLPAIVLDALLLSYVTLAACVEQPRDGEGAGAEAGAPEPLDVAPGLRAQLQGRVLASGRGFALRDLLRVVVRVRRRVSLPDSSSGFLSEGTRLAICREAMEVFGAFAASPMDLHALASVLAAAWDLPQPQVAQPFVSARPQMSVNAHDRDCRVRIGRVSLMNFSDIGAAAAAAPSAAFAHTGQALRLMERVAAAAELSEPTLLVGPTGCGKTSVVQALASSCGARLHVLNLSLQTDAADLLGGYRPLELRALSRPVYAEALALFSRLFSVQKNGRFLEELDVAFRRKRWKRLSKGLREACRMALAKLSKRAGQAQPPAAAEEDGARVGTKRRANEPSAKSQKLRRPGDELLRERWEQLSDQVHCFERQRQAVEGAAGGGFAFTFTEGTLVAALRRGDWVLLDEINLASSETLQVRSSAPLPPTAPRAFPVMRALNPWTILLECRGGPRPCGGLRREAHAPPRTLRAPMCTKA